MGFVHDDNQFHVVMILRTNLFTFVLDGVNFDPIALSLALIRSNKDELMHEE